jgi:hypothetical protein
MKKSSLKPYRIVFLMFMISAIIAAGAGEDTNYYGVTMTMVTIVPTSLKVTPVMTPPPYVYVSIKSQPSGAALWIDNAQHGTTPGSAYFSESGTHTFRLSLAGYQEYAGQFTVPGTNEILVTLTPVPPVTTVEPTTLTPTGPATPVTPVTTQPLDPGIMVAGLCIAGIILVTRRSA